MRKLFIFPIRVYQETNGFLKKTGLLKDSCVFYPTCSQYAIDAITKYGPIKGTRLSCRRILRCHPWQRNNIDPV